MPQPREVFGRAVDLVLAPGSADKIVRAGSRSDPLVALTFDDGPDPDATPHLLDLLASHGAKATFFVVGERIDGGEDVLARIVSEEHEIGNHTHSHPHTVNLARSALREEIVRATTSIERFSTHVRFVRPPWGLDRRRFVSLASELGLQVALWSIDSGDRRGCRVDQIVSNVIEGVHPGAIVLFHDLLGHVSGTIEACESILPALRSAGFELVTLSELSV